jgi:hypothetical protein
VCAGCWLAPTGCLLWDSVQIQVRVTERGGHQGAHAVPWHAHAICQQCEVVMPLASGVHGPILQGWRTTGVGSVARSDMSRKCPGAS